MADALLGMLCWEAGLVPRGLQQLAELPGNSTHPATFAFPVRYERIEGAGYETVITRPSELVLERMVDAVARMAAEGIRAVTTSCGFNVVFQERLAAASPIPVATSALLQVPAVARMLGPKCEVGVITANRGALSGEHLRQAGVGPRTPVRLAGIEHTSQWRLFREDAAAEIDLVTTESEIVEVVRQLVAEHPAVGALVLECTDLPPFGPALRRATGLAVFDVVTLTNALYAAVAPRPRKSVSSCPSPRSRSKRSR